MKYIPYMTLMQALIISEANYEAKKNDSTISTSAVQWTEVGKFGIWTICVRKHQLSFQPPKWGWRIDCGGGSSAQGGYLSINEAFEFGLKAAKEKELEFFEKFPDCKDETFNIADYK
jgi:hypothetical protein